MDITESEVEAVENEAENEEVVDVDEPIPKEPEKPAALPEKALYYMKLQQEDK